jgi:hypothetical protein
MVENGVMQHGWKGEDSEQITSQVHVLETQPSTTNRSCGSCTLCCKLMAVPELGKRQNMWCPHCEIGKQCLSYEKRPPSCVDFNCLWLQGYGDEALRPDKSKVVIGATINGDGIVFYVDPSRPQAWQQPTFKTMIEKLQSKKILVYIVVGRERIIPVL